MDEKKIFKCAQSLARQKEEEEKAYLRSRTVDLLKTSLNLLNYAEDIMDGKEKGSHHEIRSSLQKSEWRIRDAIEMISQLSNQDKEQ